MVFGWTVTGKPLISSNSGIGFFDYNNVLRSWLNFANKVK